MKSPSDDVARTTTRGEVAIGQAATDASVAGNGRLTALTGLTLLALFTAEIVTVILRVSSVLTAHVAIGLAIAPVVLLKIGSTGWRFVNYYRGDRAYVRRGAPPGYLRILGPVLITATVVLLGSGILAFAGPHWLHGAALTTHKTLFYPWLLILIVHTAAHFAEVIRLAAADLLTRSRTRLASVGARMYVLGAALVAGAVLAVAFTGHTGGYLHAYPPRH
jgi:hypothetical protein